MPTVLQMSKRIDIAPQVVYLHGVIIRNYAEETDIQPWLDLRDRTFARQRIGVRKWLQADFVTEFLQKLWWKPGRMWVAEEYEQSGTPPRLIGSVTLAMRGEPDDAKPVVHWLMVDPAWRRRGLGRLLMSHLETAAWEAGYREIWLETHVAWEAAVRFYEALGYQIVD